MRFQDAARDGRAVVYAGIQAEPVVARAAGISEEELLDDYPDLEPDDFRAIDAYAAERIAEERVFAAPSQQAVA